MAQHGYLRDYDQSWGRGDDRDRWHGDDNRNERNLNFMLGDRERSWDRDRRPESDDGFIDRIGDRARSWIGDDDRQRRNFRSQQDEHYRSWRDDQMRALDRDYADYCREREQQFHQDFDSWRRNRQLPTGQAGRQQGEEPVMELTNPASQSAEPMGASSPMADATLGTNNSENNVTGGRTRR